ncbi:TIGR04222 domain-containing membrane protein [Nonomuraea sp. NN258]|uniref:TIGR04222 domain-containing membrane protein n=1 Tax=Nonomuraea antri TaxID=2730852 RepID=UPI001568D7DF|nr:TIGR04222 domain-containing membrane protein [Nonomuraea antri]NRQ35554.1 TIGR04222 domain-containing membrane protein [Nonomuraea antri]
MSADFILILGAMVVVLIVNGAERRVERERRRIGEGPPGGGEHVLSHYELAYLSGGPRRAINTALAVLATAGAVRVSRGSQVTPVHGARPSPEPLEQAVLDAVAARPGGQRAGALRGELEHHPAVRALAYGLERRGLLVPEGAYAGARAKFAGMRIAAAVAVGYAALLAAMLATGVAGKSVTIMGAVFIGGFAVVSAFAAFGRQRRRLANVVSGAGREALTAARGRHPRGYRDPSSLAMTVGVPVALYGLTDLDDRSLCDGLAAGDPGSDCSGSCGTHGDGGTAFGSDSSGGVNCGGGSSSCGSSSSSCGSSSSSCGSSSGGSSCGSSSS